MKYEVISEFADLQDNKHVYSVGDVYPREGYTPKEGRAEELSSCRNLQQKPLIRPVEEKQEAEPKAEAEESSEVVDEAPKRKRTRKTEK